MNLFWMLLLAAASQVAVAGAPVMLRRDPLNVRHLAAPDATKTFLRSGFDYNDGNYDSGNLVRVEPPGAEFADPNSAGVLFDVAGPGVITSMWFTGKSKKGEAYLGGRLNFFFDGEAVPRISGELPAWLEDGRIFPKSLAEKSSGGWVCYAPIYFGRSLKITLSEHGDKYAHRKNGRGEEIPHIYHQFSYQRLSEPVRSSHLRDPRWTHFNSEDKGKVLVDKVALPEGGRREVFKASGQGILNAFRLHWRELDPDQIRLRISVDGETPVELTVPEFWGFSRKVRPKANFKSLLLGVDGMEGYYSSFPMPHRKDFVIELENSGPGGEVMVSTTHQEGWPESEQFYFHARRVNEMAQAGRDVKLLEAQGRGHFVGTILELADQTLEGDDRFYVDGEPFPPAWHGTGTEDYFRCGWYFFGGPLTRPLYGLLDGAKPKIAYRFHLADRVNFTQSVVIGFEHGHANKYIGPFRGTVFWYSEEP